MACFACRPDTSGAVPGAFVILLAQDAESAWSFTVRQVPLWLGRIVQVSGTCCKLHFFTRCRSGIFCFGLHDCMQTIPKTSALEMHDEWHITVDDRVGGLQDGAEASNSCA